jgi:hypothetical protein
MISARRSSRLLILPFVLALLVAADARAQTGVCASEVMEAEELYRDGRFEAAARILSDCLDTRSGITQETAIRGYRLLGLSRLQDGDIAGARIAVLRVFARNPDYQADPVLDPPGYQALVETVRQQLADREFQEEVEDLRPRLREPVHVPIVPETYRARGAVAIRGFSGVSSYGGDRGTPEENVFVDFVANAGKMLGFGLSLNLHEYAGIYLYYETAYTPSLFESRARVFPAVDPSTSSRWIQTMGLQAVGRLLPDGLASPYLRVGPGIAIARLNDEVRVGTAVDVTAGVDFRLRHDVGLFAEAGARWVFPGDAMDLVAWDYDHDLFTQIRIGALWRVGRLF